MKHLKVNTFNCDSAWYDTLYTIYKEGDMFKVDNGSETTLTKKINFTLEIEHPEIRPLINDKAPTSMSYVNEYVLRYLWLSKEEAMDDSDYTYADRLKKPIDQIEGIVDKYTKCLNDRQCTMVIRLPSDINSDNPPCLSIIDTEIIDNKLNMICYFRSWDAYGGLCSNIAGIQLLNEAIVKEINDKGNLEITTGRLIFHCKNAHIYERTFGLVDELINKKTTSLRVVAHYEKESK